MSRHADPSRPRPVAAVAVAVAITALAFGLFRLLGAGGDSPLGEGPAPSFAAAPPGTEVLIGAGDIARCEASGDEATARLLDVLPGTVFTAGDNAYDQGRPDEFARCYDPTWGRHRERTRFPAPGNHDWDTPGAAGYLGYFGAAARPAGTTWYSAELGSWHVVVLDSECDAVGGCNDGSPQVEWLRADLASSAARATRCTLAIWHHPRFSSGVHGDDARLDAAWRVLHAAGVEVVVNGHEHSYERFAPQDPNGAPDPTRGIRQFVVGTGGTRLTGFHRARPNSQVRESHSHGVLRLGLATGGYSWAFVPVAGAEFRDDGVGTCH